MSIDTSIRALRDASPNSEPGFDEWIERFDVLSERIPTISVSVRRRERLHASPRVIGFSAAVTCALVAAAVFAGLTLTAASPPSASAAAKKALAATAGAASGTMAATVTHDGSSYTLDTTQWNGSEVGVTRGQRSQLGANQQLLLIDGGAYVQQANGTWVRYPSASDLGRLGSVAQLAQDDVAGNTADQILSLTTGLTQTTQPHGTTLYSGTIPNSDADPGVAPTDDSIIRIITNLRSGNEPGAPGGIHNGLQLRMIVGSDGFVQRVSLTFQQQNTGSPTGDGTYTWTVVYSQLGTTPPTTAPATWTPAGSAATPSSTTTDATTTTGG
jgi:hypothetical protein